MESTRVVKTRVVKTGVFGIEVTLTDVEIHAVTPNRYNGGTITSQLHEFPSGSEEEEKDISDYNLMMDGIESMVLAHACAGIDITTPAYLEGIETAVQGCDNNS